MGVEKAGRNMIPEGPEGNPIVSVEYELFGQVQGCFFQKYAKEIAESLCVGGWIKNTKKGTIVGKLQGPKTALQQMYGIYNLNFNEIGFMNRPIARLEWMIHEGSPGSRVEKVDLNQWEFTSTQDFKNFSIRF